MGEARSLPAEGALATGETQLVTRRGRQRTPKPWLMAVLCRMGLHKGPWAFVAEGNCAQGRECERCGSVHVRTKHQREWVYVSEQTCEQLRTCMRCKDTNCERTKHEWSNSWIVSGAKMAHRCEHCGVEETWDDYGD